MTKEEIIKKHQLKKIAIQSFIWDECDQVPERSKTLFAEMIGAIFLEFIKDLKQLNEVDVERSGVCPICNGVGNYEDDDEGHIRCNACMGSGQTASELH